MHVMQDWQIRSRNIASSAARLPDGHCITQHAVDSVGDGDWAIEAARRRGGPGGSALAASSGTMCGCAAAAISDTS